MCPYIYISRYIFVRKSVKAILNCCCLLIMYMFTNSRYYYTKCMYTDKNICLYTNCMSLEFLIYSNQIYILATRVDWQHFVNGKKKAAQVVYQVTDRLFPNFRDSFDGLSTPKVAKGSVGLFSVFRLFTSQHQEKLGNLITTLL